MGLRAAIDRVCGKTGKTLDDFDVTFTIPSPRSGERISCQHKGSLLIDGQALKEFIYNPQISVEEKRNAISMGPGEQYYLCSKTLFIKPKGAATYDMAKSMNGQRTTLHQLNENGAAMIFKKETLSDDQLFTALKQDVKEGNDVIGKCARVGAFPDYFMINTSGLTDKQLLKYFKGADFLFTDQKLVTYITGTKGRFPGEFVVYFRKPEFKAATLLDSMLKEFSTGEASNYEGSKDGKVPPGYKESTSTIK